MFLKGPGRVPKFLERTIRKGPAVEVLANIDMTSVIAHVFFIAAGVAVGVRAADDLVLWREHRAAKRLAEDTRLT